MNTTALISELLVGGIIALTALTFFILGIFQIESSLNILQDLELMGGTIFLALSYALGVLLDRLWDRITKPIDRRIRITEKITTIKLRKSRQKLFSKEGKVPEYLEYIRSRMRVARSCLCSFTLLSMSILFFYIRTSSEVDWKVLVTISGGSFAAIGLSYFAFKQLLKTYYKQFLTLAKFHH